MALTYQLLCVIAILLAQAIAQSTTSTVQCQTSLTPDVVTTISSPSQASALASTCSFYPSSIFIDYDTSEDLVFTGLQGIGGDLLIKFLNKPIQLQFPALQNVNRTLMLLGPWHSNDVSLAKLVSVGTLYLQNYDFTINPGRTDTIQHAVASGNLKVQKSVLIWNTTITNIDLPGWSFPSENITIQYNPHLASMKLTGSIASTLIVTDNGGSFVTDDSGALPSALSVDLSSVPSIGDVDLRSNHALTVSSIPSVNNSIRFASNDGTTNLNIGQLSGLKGNLEISSNPDLVQASFPQLASVQGDFRVLNNSQLFTAGDFPSLKVVGGSVNLAGPLSNISSLSQLALVSGAFTIDSSTSFPCSDVYKSLSTRKVLQNGSFGCKSPSDSSGQTSLINSDPSTSTLNSGTSATGSPTTTSSQGSLSGSTGQSDGGNKKLSPGAIAGIAVGAVVGVLLLFLAGVFFWRKRRHARHEKDLPPSEPDQQAYSPYNAPGLEKRKSATCEELPHYHGLYQLSGESSPQELATDRFQPSQKTKPVASRVHELP